MKKVLNREEVKIENTWDLSRLYSTENEYENDLVILEEKVNIFYDKYYKKLKNEEDILNSITDYIEILKLLTYTQSYQSLHSSVDQRNDVNIKRSGNFSILSNKLNQKMIFYYSELLRIDNNILEKAISKNNEYSLFLKDVIRDKKHMIDPKVEEALGEFNQVINSSYGLYNSFKFSDMKFNEFNVDNNKYPNSFSMFENEWQYDTNHLIRRNAFESFYDKLSEYENGLALNYHNHVLKEKAYANLKGFESVFDYLLFNQRVSNDMYDRQIDLIMKHLSKPMQKYANLIKEIYNLDEMTYADLNLSIDPEFEKEVTIDEAKAISLEALSVYGKDYLEMVNRSFSERWIDFPQNLGKSTGGFCSSPYNKGSYILLNWNNQMNETFVLAHELGHAGHFYFAGKNQNILNTRSSMYFIEAPSTINELVMADYLNNKENDLRFRRWVLSNIISRTYYHNFVTHLLEADFQREVYRLVDAKKHISASTLKSLKLNTLKKFWQDSVNINDYAGLTWMRQPHYYMGLYPYTYSAGLTVATKVFKDIKDGILSYEDWINVLKQGGSMEPLELAKLVNVDLSTEKPLLDTIKVIDVMIDEIISITKELNSK